MRILITGSSGFIGFHLSKKLLDNKNKIHGIDSMNNYYDVKLKQRRFNILKKYKRFSFSKINIENKKHTQKIFKKFNPDIVIHLAAQAGVRYSLEKPHVYLNTNITGTFNVIEASHVLVRAAATSTSKSVLPISNVTTFA